MTRLLEADPAVRCSTKASSARLVASARCQSSSTTASKLPAVSDCQPAAQASKKRLRSSSERIGGSAAALPPTSGSRRDSSSQAQGGRARKVSRVNTLPASARSTRVQAA